MPTQGGSCNRTSAEGKGELYVYFCVQVACCCRDSIRVCFRAERERESPKSSLFHSNYTRHGAQLCSRPNYPAFRLISHVADVEKKTHTPLILRHEVKGHQTYLLAYNYSNN